MKPLTLMLTAAGAATALALAAVPANTQQSPVCGKRDDIVKSLADQFDERPQAVGLVDEDAVLEVFVSDSGSWTILATGTDGNSCLVSSGESWESQDRVIGASADAGA